MGCPRDPGFGPETLTLSADCGRFGLQGDSDLDAGQNIVIQHLVPRELRPPTLATTEIDEGTVA